MAEGPSEFIKEISDLLNAYQSYQGQDVFLQTLKEFNAVLQDQNNYIFQSKARPSLFRGILLCQNSPQELYEVSVYPISLYLYPLRPPSSATCCFIGILDLRHSCSSSFPVQQRAESFGSLPSAPCCEPLAASALISFAL